MIVWVILLTNSMLKRSAAIRESSKTPPTQRAIVVLSWETVAQEATETRYHSLAGSL